jgi:hypothetical protein
MQYYPDIYILAGQSGMSGRGVLSELPVFANYTKVMTYANSGKWVYATEPVDSEAGQVDAVSSDTSPGAGPGLSFGSAIYDLRPGRYVGLVPCAKGATGIDAWARNLSRTTLYGSMIARAQEAAGSGSIKGLLWYQGESDAIDLTLANAWAGKFTQFVADVRSDLGASIKMVMTVLGPDPSDAFYPAWSTMIANQQSITLPGGVARVTANDLTAQTASKDHLTTASQVALGQRYAAAMAALLTT